MKPSAGPSFRNQECKHEQAAKLERQAAKLQRQEAAGFVGIPSAHAGIRQGQLAAIARRQRVESAALGRKPRRPELGQQSLNDRRAHPRSRADAAIAGCVPGRLSFTDRFVGLEPATRQAHATPSAGFSRDRRGRPPP